jgi:hypothetical protein
MIIERPIVFDEKGTFRLLPLTAPLIVGDPQQNDHAVTLEVLEQLIKEKQENTHE